mmetsp:Transcript_21925/g.43456  ORF Transcript_21925/g.43456 Transcript_21925/m.43456 type:complete len:364 (-) Transcript_21925:532-1623(-)
MKVITLNKTIELVLVGAIFVTKHKIHKLHCILRHILDEIVHRNGQQLQISIVIITTTIVGATTPSLLSSSQPLQPNDIVRHAQNVPPGQMSVGRARRGDHLRRRETESVPFVEMVAEVFVEGFVAGGGVGSVEGVAEGGDVGEGLAEGVVVGGGRGVVAGAVEFDWGMIVPSGSQSGNDVIGKGYSVSVEMLAWIVDMNPFFGSGILRMIAVVADDHFEWISNEMNYFDFDRCGVRVFGGGSIMSMKPRIFDRRSIISYPLASVVTIIGTACFSSAFSAVRPSPLPTQSLHPHPTPRQNLSPNQRLFQHVFIAKQIGTFLNVHRSGPEGQSSGTGRATIVLSDLKGRSGPIADLIEGDSNGGR